MEKIFQTNYFEAPSIGGVFSCAALTLFAYLGYEDVVHISEEVKNPTRNVPRALFLSLMISTLLYIFVSVSMVGVVSWRELGASESPFVLVASRVLGEGASPIFAFIALFATANTVLILLVVSSRIMYGMAEDGSSPKALARIHGRTGTPTLSIVVVMTLSVLFTFLEDIKVVAHVTNFMTFAVFSFVSLSCILLRHTRPELERPFRAPLNIGKHSLTPLLSLISLSFLMIHLDTLSIMIGTLTLMAGGFV